MHDYAYHKGIVHIVHGLARQRERGEKSGNMVFFMCIDMENQNEVSGCAKWVAKMRWMKLENIW